METGISDVEGEMRNQMLKALRVLIYNSSFEKHMLKMYSNLTYKPLQTEKKIIVPVNPGAGRKKQTETEMEKMANEALAKVDEALSKAKMAKVLITEPEGKQAKTVKSGKSETAKSEVSKGPAKKHKASMQNEDVKMKKQPEVKKVQPQPTIQLSAQAQIPISAEETKNVKKHEEKKIEENLIIPIEQTVIIKHKAYEDKYKRLQKIIKESQAAFEKTVENESKTRSELVSKYNQRLAKLIPRNKKEVKVNSQTQEWKAIISLSKKSQLVQDVIVPKLESICSGYGSNSAISLIDKAKLVYEGWLYIRIYSADIAIDKGSIKNIDIAKEKSLVSIMNAIHWKDFKATTTQTFKILYASCNEISLWMQKNIRKYAQSLKKGAGSPLDVIKEIKRKSADFFRDINYLLTIKIGQLGKRIGAHIIKSIAENLKNKEHLKKMLHMLSSLHFVMGSLRNSKSLICYSKENKKKK